MLIVWLIEFKGESCSFNFGFFDSQSNIESYIVFSIGIKKYISSFFSEISFILVLNFKEIIDMGF